MVVGWLKLFFSVTYWKYSLKIGWVSSASLSHSLNLFYISISLSGDTGSKQSQCPNSFGRKHIRSGKPDIVACFDSLILKEISKAKPNSFLMHVTGQNKNVGFMVVLKEVDPPTLMLFPVMWPMTFDNFCA